VGWVGKKETNLMHSAEADRNCLIAFYLFGKNDWKKFSLVSITGPRQAGKTTLPRNYFQDYKYFNLERIFRNFSKIRL